MIIRDMFADDINRKINGVIKVDQAADEVIEQELNEYVITKELKKHFITFFNYYSDALDEPTADTGVWISGSVIFIFSIRPVDATDSLEQIMITHGFINIQVCCAWSVKTSQQFIHHNQQLHLRRFLFKLFFDTLFKCGQFLISKHSLVDFLFVFFFAFLRQIGRSCSNALRGRLIGSYNGAFSKAHAHEDFPILACQSLCRWCTGWIWSPRSGSCMRN